MAYFVVSNIPGPFRSCDLRRHFKQFTESGWFECFHFRHRPEVTPATTDQPKKEATFCCVVRVLEEEGGRFLETYHHKRWTAEKEEEETSGGMTKLGVAVILRRSKTELGPLLSLPELNPPSVMKRGNVGTPTRTFLDLVNRCKLPPPIIKKLKLEFPRPIKRKQYSAVAPPQHLIDEGWWRRVDRTEPVETEAVDTGTEAVETEVVETTGTEAVGTEAGETGTEAVGTGTKEVDTTGTEAVETETVVGTGETSQEKQSANDMSKETGEASERPPLPEERQSSPPVAGSSKKKGGGWWSESERREEHDGAEDWERHESFHNDVGTQDRTKERLFEEEMEIVWDKGSSGLVFYTDANHWADLEGKDTDGLWADEWDVDMGVYEGHRGDKDARDSQAMRESDQLARFGDTDEAIGDFERHTKGFGGRIMRGQGWSAGKGLGKSKIGMTEPLSAEDAKHPRDKGGLGYRGESLLDAIRRNNPKPAREPMIGSKFDTVIDHKDSARRTEDPTVMKYRKIEKKIEKKS